MTPTQDKIARLDRATKAMIDLRRFNGPALTHESIAKIGRVFDECLNAGSDLCKDTNTTDKGE
jgi:hypothetical protein